MAWAWTKRTIKEEGESQASRGGEERRAEEGHEERNGAGGRERGGQEKHARTSDEPAGFRK